jgi:hypothetical protein
MDKAEAMKRFGLKETDSISKEGVEVLIRSREKLLRTGMNKYDRAEVEKDLEALRTLIQ